MESSKRFLKKNQKMSVVLKTEQTQEDDTLTWKMFGCKFWLQIRLVLEAPDWFNSDFDAIVLLHYLINQTLRRRFVP